MLCKKRVTSSPLIALFGLLAVFSAIPASLAAGEKNLIVNGDFETPSLTNPPQGWVMWGPQRDKVAAHYARDTQHPHGGRACFRIYHPASAESYAVTAPQTAIRPKQGMMYSVSFWARSDRPGDAAFGWVSYQTIRSFVDAAAPGYRTIQVDRQWREFHFEVHEGWDLFADKSHYLMLSFKPAAQIDQERTLWIDDVVVTERPSPRKDRLANPATIRYAPLDHRLKEGPELAMVVDCGKRIRKASREVGGVSFHRVAGFMNLPYDKEGRYRLPAEQEEAIRQLRLPMTRFYALGDEPFTLEAAIDKAAVFLKRIGVSQATVPLEFETQGATRTLSPEVWARGVRHSIERGYGFRYWEITNEPYLGHPGMAFTTADDYLEHFLAVGRAIRRVHAEARIGLAINSRSPAWGNYLLKKAAGHYDFVVPHYYCGAHSKSPSFEDFVLAGNYQLLDEALRVNALLRAYNPGRDGREVYQYDTEWGLHTYGPNHERADDVVRNGNITGMMHRAVRLIYYLREGMLRGASSWEMLGYRRSPGFTFLAQDAPHLRSMNYWLYYYFNRHVCPWVVAIDGTAPYYQGTVYGRTYRGPLTPAVATLSDDGRRLAIIVANGSWQRAMPCRMETRHFTARRAEAVLLTHSDPEGNPLLADKDELVRALPVSLEGAHLTFTLPAHAVAFVSLEQ